MPAQKSPSPYVLQYLEQADSVSLLPHQREQKEKTSNHITQNSNNVSLSSHEKEEATTEDEDENNDNNHCHLTNKQSFFFTRNKDEGNCFVNNDCPHSSLPPLSPLSPHT